MKQNWLFSDTMNKEKGTERSYKEGIDIWDDLRVEDTVCLRIGEVGGGGDRR
jgi:hypothetical protein